MSGGALRRQLEASLGTAYIIEHELGGGGMSCDFPVPRPLVRRPSGREYGGASTERRLPWSRSQTDLLLARPLLRGCSPGALLIFERLLHADFIHPRPVL